MKPAPTILSGVIALCLLASTGALAALQETQEGVSVEDFEHGTLDQFGVDEREQQQESRVPEVLEITRDEGQAALHLKGGFQNRVWLKDRTFGDFSLEVRMRKAAGSYAGVAVRDDWVVFFRLKGFVALNNLQHSGMLFQSEEVFQGYNKLRVVCAGPVLHIYVNDQLILKRIGLEPREGRVALYAHNAEAYYDDLRIDTHVAPEDYLVVEPEAPDDCLVFAPQRDVTLRFRAGNYSGLEQRVALTGSVQSWDDASIAGPVAHEVRVAPGANATVDFDMGRIPIGFYRAELTATSAGKQICALDDLPLAVQQRGSGAFKAPLIPVAAYYKYYNKRGPLYENTYAHAAARNLREHAFNAVVADPSFSAETIDIFRSYGIATIARSAQFVDRPGVIATLLGDEPKPDEVDELKRKYQELSAQTDKPITTCLVGDALGLGAEGGPLWIWRQLQPTLRCFRWYGIKKSFYGLLHEVKYKPYLPLSSVLRIAEASSDTPYWLVAPALGKTEHEAYYHRPTPAETRGMMHLALAYGADGILFWAFQSHASWPCLVQQESLEPVDANYQTAAEVAAAIRAHAELIHSLEHIGLDVRCPSPVVDAVPRKSTIDDELYVYAVNKDAAAPVSTRLLLWAERWSLSGVHDVFGDEELPIERDDEGYLSIPLTLAPGDGTLLRMDVADAQ